MPGQSDIAVIRNREGTDHQDLLAGAVADWREAGLRIAGVIAEADRGEGPCSAGFLCDIASGQKFSIQLDAPPAGTSCHLDGDGVGAAAAALLDQIPTADIVVFSKFGKLEAMQQGLWPAFRAAVATRKPIVTTVSAKHVDAWGAFAPSADWLAPDPAAIVDWWRAIRPDAR